MDLVIIGRGPAGLTAAIYAARAGIDVVVIGNTAGATTSAAEIENYFGFEQPISGKALMANGLAQAKRLGVKIIDEEVTSASWGKNDYLIKTTTQQLETKALVIATGASRKRPSIPDLAKFEGKGVSFCAVCDAFFMKQKSVAVVGNSDYAINEAHELLPFAKSIVILTNGFAPSPSLLNAGFKVITSKITELKGENSLEQIIFDTGEIIEINGLFVAEGIASAKSFATKLGLESNDKGLGFHDGQASNIPGVFVCGDCTGVLPQIAVAVGQGATAGLAAANYLKLLRGEKAVAIQWSKH